MTSKNVLYLTEADVAACMTPAEAVALAEIGVRADGAGKVLGDKFYMDVAGEGFIKPFSGYLEGEEYAYVKSFSFFENNPAQGLPVTDSMVILFEAQTGLPVCVMEANWITSLKTGASTAVTAKYLARQDSKIATIFGAGGLGRTHLLCLNEVFSLDEVRIVDVIPEAAENFIQEMTLPSGPALHAVSSAKAAVRGADIIITVTTGSAINVQLPWLKPGAFVARLGSYQEIDLPIILQADKFIVDRWHYVNYRVPELIELIQQGQLDESSVHGEWPQIAAGHAAGREKDDEIILYIALGIWGEYAAILPQVYRKAKELSLGRYPSND